MSGSRLPLAIEESVFEVLGGPEESWQSAIDALCESHPRHAAAIRARLARAAIIQAQLESDPIAIGEDHDTAPERVGPFRILRVLGEGGMGTVYLGEQSEPLARRVAIKVIKAGMDSRRVLQRFELERQALGLMSHHAIARVLEAGTTDDGRPWFAMEFVDGTAITEYCDRARLDLASRLRLFCEVCDAVQYAHQKGVIHRDLKPSNVLVTDEEGHAVAKVIDFGLARATDQDDRGSLATRSDVVIGTPEDMSPEQVDEATFDIDTRTDVYALGVTLYELLTGSLPFSSAVLRGVGETEMRRRIREDDPPTPSSRVSRVGDDEAGHHRDLTRMQLARELRGDLDWIVTKAIAKERERRYQSPRELAEDIGRHLDGLPVRASPPSLRYRVGRFARRHRAQVVAVAVTVVAAIGWLATSTWLWLDADAARHEAEDRATEARQITDFLVELFEHASPAHGRGVDLPVRFVLEQGERRLKHELHDQPRVRARLFETLAGVRGLLGSFDVAATHYEVAESLGADVASDRALALAFDGRFDEAQELAELVLKRALDTGDHEQEAECRRALALVAQRRDQNDQAVRELHAARAAARAAGSQDVETNVVLQLAGAVLDTGHADEAVQIYDDALADLERRFPDGHPSVPIALTGAAVAALDLGEFDRAERYLARARGETERMLGGEHPLVATVLRQEADYVRARGRITEAITKLERAVAIERKTRHDADPDLAWSLNDLGSALLTLGRHADAAHYLGQSLEIYRRAYADDHLDTAICLANLAEAVHGSGDATRGRALLRDATAMLDRLGLGDSDHAALQRIQLAWIEILDGQLDRAESEARAALMTFERGEPSESRQWEAARARIRLAFVMNQRRRGAQAAGYAHEAFDTMRRIRPWAHIGTARARYQLGWACLVQGDLEGTEEHMRASIAMYRELSDDPHPEIIFPLGHLAGALVETRPADAALLFSEAIEIRRRASAAGDYWLVGFLAGLGRSHELLGRPTEAEPLLVEAWESSRAARGPDDPTTHALKAGLDAFRKRRDG